MEYITIKEAAAKWGISASRIGILVNEGRIPGAQRLGKSWLIPAGATKPTPKRRSRRGASAGKERETNSFSFPLYHFRPDWDSAKQAQLSEQQQSLLLAERAVLECRFADAWPLLEAILHAPDDIYTEIGCLWNAGMCCISMNRPDDFFRIFLRLQMLLSQEFPHRDDLVIILDELKTYVETMASTASSTAFNTNVHKQALPLTCVLMGYAQLTREAIKPGSAEVSLLELNLRFLETTGAVIAMEMMHCYLLGIYSLRQNTEEAEKHAKAVVQIAYENKLYFPLVSYYCYNVPIFSPILDRYPEEFQNLCRELSSQYEENFTAFLTSISEDSVFSKLTDTDYLYAFAVLTGLSNTRIAKESGVSLPTVSRRLDKLCAKLGVKSKKDLKDFLLSNM